MMTPEKIRFSQLWLNVAELYAKKLSTVMLDLYWQTLAAYPLNAIEHALKAHLVNPDNGQFMPKPADIIRILEGNSSSQALNAWTKVRQAIQLVGSYDSIVFDDPLIHAVISDMEGWIALCQHSEAELNYRARDFEKRYSAYLHKKPHLFPKYLIGITEKQNQIVGFNQNKRILFGNAVLAKKIAHEGCEPHQYLLQKNAMIEHLSLFDSTSLIESLNTSRSQLLKQPSSVANEQEKVSDALDTNQ